VQHHLGAVRQQHPLLAHCLPEETLATVAGHSVAYLASDRQAHPGGKVRFGLQDERGEQLEPKPDPFMINRLEIGSLADTPRPRESEGATLDCASPGLTRR
jgi:hypothetical protein